jgi:hypothetical protein
VEGKGVSPAVLDAGVKAMEAVLYKMHTDDDYFMPCKFDRKQGRHWTEDYVNKSLGL